MKCPTCEREMFLIVRPHHVVEEHYAEFATIRKYVCLDCEPSECSLMEELVIASHLMRVRFPPFAPKRPYDKQYMDDFYALCKANGCLQAFEEEFYNKKTINKP